MARIVSLDFLAIFKVFGLDAAAADADAGTILDSGQAPSPHAQGWNKPQGETPRSDQESCQENGTMLSNSCYTPGTDGESGKQ